MHLQPAAEIRERANVLLYSDIAEADVEKHDVGPDTLPALELREKLLVVRPQRHPHEVRGEDVGRTHANRRRVCHATIMMRETERRQPGPLARCALPG